MAQHPGAANPQVLQHAIELSVAASSPSMTASCHEQYRLALTADLKDRSRLVNEMICRGSMCPYLTGPPGTGVLVNQSAVLNKHVVYAAIDTSSLTDAVSFGFDASTVCIKPLLLNN